MSTILSSFVWARRVCRCLGNNEIWNYLQTFPSLFYLPKYKVDVFDLVYLLRRRTYLFAVLRVIFLSFICKFFIANLTILALFFKHKTYLTYCWQITYAVFKGRLFLKLYLLKKTIKPRCYSFLFLSKIIFGLVLVPNLLQVHLYFQYQPKVLLIFRLFQPIFSILHP